MPADTKAPIILVGPGTGIAPFRGFWHHRLAQIKMNSGKNNNKNIFLPETKGNFQLNFFFIEQEFGKIWLFFGCRQKELDLYRQEKKEMQALGVIDKVFLALSREPNVKKALKTIQNN